MKLITKIPQKEIQQALRTIDRYGEAKLKKVRNTIAKTVVKVHAGAVQKVPVNEGVLRSGINFGFEAKGLIGVVESNAAYSLFVHEGRGPGGFPPMQIIARWAYLRRIAPSDNLQDPKTRQIAYLIGRKIAKYGTQGVPFLRDSFNENTKGFYRELVKDMRELEKNI